MSYVEIGDKFAEILKSQLSTEEFNAVKKRNAADTTTLNCASYDFCDANEAMIEAFEFFNEELPDDDNNQQQFALWNNAWQYAKDKYLTEK